MTCDSARFALKAYLDAELGPFAAGRVRRHLRRCAACAAELASLQQFHVLLRGADPVPASERAFVPLGAPRRVAVWKVAGGALATAALTALLIVLPTVHQSPRNPSSAAVGAALSHVNTWHFSGWKQIGGRRVPWDIWGRRAPFLLYERVGSEITLDNGKERTRMFLPAPGLNRSRGLVVHMASEGATIVESANSGGSLDDLVNQWDWEPGADGMSLAQRTALNAVFRQQYSQVIVTGVNCNQLFTINRTTSLPIRYQLHYNTRVSQYDTEQLNAAYDVSLPKAVMSLPIPADYQQINLTTPSAAALSVQSRVLAFDPKGNILLRYQCRMDGLLLTPDSLFSVSVSSAGDQGLRQGAMLPYIVSTNDGMSYPNAAGDVFDFEAPLKPLGRAGGLPTRLRVMLSVSPQIAVQDSDILEWMPPQRKGVLKAADFRPRQSGQTLLTATVTQTLALPPKPTTPSVAVAAPNELKWVFAYTPLDASVDFQRSNYYFFSSRYQYLFYRKVAPDLIQRGVIRPDGSLDMSKVTSTQKLLARMTALQTSHALEFKRAKQVPIAQSAFWLQQWLAALQARHPNDATIAGNMIELAMRYRDAGEWPQAQTTLRRLIHIMQQHPQEWGVELRQARYALRTQQFPDDPHYKGPT